MLLEIECTLSGFANDLCRMKCVLLLVNAIALIQVVDTLSWLRWSGVLNQNSSAHGGSLVPEETNANSNKEELDLESQEVAIGNQL